MYRVRFHLAKGEHYMHWQIKDTEDDSVVYYDPNKTELILTNCTLKNQMGTAEKIFKGADKTVCAWIECEDYEIKGMHRALRNSYRLSYNPRNLPFWIVPERPYHNLDNCFIKTIITGCNKLFGEAP